VLGCIAVGLCAAVGIEGRTLLRRLLLFVPFTALIAAGIPVSQGFRGGWDTAAGIVVRGTISLLVGLWLAKAVPVERLLRSLERIGCPAVLTTLAAFMLRYAFVLHEEAGRMRNARAARSVGPLGAVRGAQLAAQLVGMLLIRTMDRADRVHRAMCARGWDGRLRRLDD
jgi:cobalt/nickel transport system permease protein